MQDLYCLKATLPSISVTRGRSNPTASSITRMLTDFSKSFLNFHEKKRKEISTLYSVLAMSLMHLCTCAGVSKCLSLSHRYTQTSECRCRRNAHPMQVMLSGVNRVLDPEKAIITHESCHKLCAVFSISTAWL